MLYPYRSIQAYGFISNKCNQVIKKYIHQITCTDFTQYILKHHADVITYMHIHLYHKCTSGKKFILFSFQVIKNKRFLTFVLDVPMQFYFLWLIFLGNITQLKIKRRLFYTNYLLLEICGNSIFYSYGLKHFARHKAKFFNNTSF